MGGRQQAATLLVIEDVPIDVLHADPANARRMPEAMARALDRSLAEFGIVQPVLARRADSVIIAGHQRVAAARRNGLATVPVIWLDVSVRRARQIGLALNKVSGEWDETLLARMLAELDAAGDVDLSLTGFADDEVRTLLRSLEAREQRDRPEEFDLDAALEATRQPRSAPGTIWQLGEHIVMCGDATNPADVERLLGGRLAAMAFTDPPYNVRLGDHGGQGRGSRRRRMANDDLDEAEFELFCRGWAPLLLGSVSGAIYLCMSSKEWPLVNRVLAEAGGHWSTTIIWAKDRFTLGRAPYQRGYEPIWFGWRQGVHPVWAGGRDQSDVWQIPRPSDASLHPATKPLALIERAIDNSSRPGDLVLDLFGGSGSTLIAAQRTGRLAAVLEIDARYVDVIVARWEAFTERSAVRRDG